MHISMLLASNIYFQFFSANSNNKSYGYYLLLSKDKKMHDKRALEVFIFKLLILKKY